MRARFSQVCRRCDWAIQPGDPIAPYHGDYIHAHCAPGYEDED